jgi:hypothetical protein
MCHHEILFFHSIKHTSRAERISTGKGFENASKNYQTYSLPWQPPVKTQFSLHNNQQRRIFVHFPKYYDSLIFSFSFTHKRKMMRKLQGR